MAEKTIETYTTKGFNHEGVTGSTPVKDLNTKVSAITPQVMQENNSPVQKIVKDGVKTRAVGNGMPGDSGKVKNQKHEKGQSAGQVGSTQVSHS